MTLSQYEQSIPTMPAADRGPAAGPAWSLRDRLVVDPTFATALAAICSQRQHADRLTLIGQYQTFSTLTGP